MPTIPITRKAAQLAKEIASEIRVRGHFKGSETKDETCLDGVCIVSNSSFYKSGYTVEDRISLIDSIIAVAGVQALNPHDHASRRYAVTQWNDHSPTERVLEVLDQISAE